MTKAAKQIPALSEKDKERFFDKISKSPTERGCLEWTACRIRDGYGVFGIGSKTFLAHRIAYFISTGDDPLELLVCHHCDNPSCCEPSHLWLGTDAENGIDRDRKGRGNPNLGDKNGSRLHPESRPRGDSHYSRINPELMRRGESHPRAKLNAIDVAIIRADQRTLRVIASDYGVTDVLISKIKNRKIWRHVD